MRPCSWDLCNKARPLLTDADGTLLTLEGKVYNNVHKLGHFPVKRCHNLFLIVIHIIAFTRIR